MEPEPYPLDGKWAWSRWSDQTQPDQLPMALFDLLKGGECDSLRIYYRTKEDALAALAQARATLAEARDDYERESKSAPYNPNG